MATVHAAYEAWQREPGERKRVVELERELRRVSAATGVRRSELLDRLTTRSRAGMASR